MKGSVFRYKKAWAGVIDLERGLDGERKQRWVYGKTKKEVDEKLAKIFTALRAGTYTEPSKITVGEYLAQWLLSVKSSVSIKTIERYEDLVKGHLVPAIGGVPLQKLTAAIIEDHYAHALESGRKDGKGGLSKQTVLHQHRILREALAKAVRRDLIFRNPADLADAPKPKKRSRSLSPRTRLSKF